MPAHETPSTKHQRSPHPANLQRSEDRHFDSENRSDRDDSYNYSHGSLRTAREERAPYPQSDRRRHSQYDYPTGDRLSGSVMKDHHWTSHDRPKTISSRSHERFNRVDDGRESSNGLRNTIRNTPNEHRQIRRKERSDRMDEPEIAHEKRHEYSQKSRDNYYRFMGEELEPKSPAACYSNSDVTSFKARDRSNILDEHMEHHPYTADRRSERLQHGLLRHSTSRGRPSSRGSSSHSLSSASDSTGDSRETHTPKEGSSFGRRLSLRDGRRSPSPSRSPTRSESRHRGISSSSKSVKKDGHKHSGKRKHRDRSASPDDRRRRKYKEKEREKDKETSREKEKMRKKDEERRSVLTGKKIKLKVKKDKGDHERDANRRELLHFLNSAFE